MVATALFIASLLALVRAKPVTHTFVVHERLDAAPQGFVHNGAASESESLNLRIALVSKDMAGLEKALYDVSTPGSELYGQHLSKEEVEAFVAPTSKSVSAVNQWLSDHGLASTVISPAGDWIGIKVPVSKANEMFDTQFSVFTNQKNGEQTIRTLSYSIPAALREHIELVHPTLTFPAGSGSPKFAIPMVRTEKNLTSRAVPASCKSTITPACLQALYGIPTTHATQSSNRIAVSGFKEQFAQSADLQSFLKSLRPDLLGTSFTTQVIDGGSNPQGQGRAGTEANMDVQYTVGVASGVPVTFISVGSNVHDGDLLGFLDITNNLLAQSTPPHVLTTSYGQNENSISRALANNLCNAYMQLGARGTSILFASGDGGVAGSDSTNCSTFIPTFPSGCPFMTSVGATTGIAPEVAADFSSGGFSNYFAAPSYQRAAVSTFLTALGSTNAGKFNKTGRGYPDVSAQGDNVKFFTGGEFQTISGTSSSSPIFASVIGLLNDRLIAAGKSPLGFLNPFLYSAAGKAALTDITSGSNPGCGTNGFTARAGWDPVTGLGTPKFASLLAAIGV